MASISSSGTRHLARAPALVVVTPNFQNPTGATLPLGQPQALLDHRRARGHRCWSKTISTASCATKASHRSRSKQLDETGDTVLLRSFSKLAFPGLRVGWVIAPRAVDRTADRSQAVERSAHRSALAGGAVAVRRVGPAGGASQADAGSRAGALAAAIGGVREASARQARRSRGPAAE